MIKPGSVFHGKKLLSIQKKHNYKIKCKNKNIKSFCYYKINHIQNNNIQVNELTCLQYYFELANILKKQAYQNPD